MGQLVALCCVVIGTYIALQSPANLEAAKLYVTNMGEYNKRVRRVAARSVDD